MAEIREARTALVYDARQGEEGARRFVNASKQVIDIQAQVARQQEQTGKLVEAVQARTTATTQQYARAFEELRRRADPTIAAMERYRRGVETVDVAVQKGLASQREASRVIEFLKSRYDAVALAQRQATQQAGDHARSVQLQAHQITNLTAQINDVVVSLASGQRPLMVLLQQGSQIAPIFGGLAATAKAAAGALLTPTAGLVAGVVAFGTAMSAGIARAASMAGEIRSLDARMTGMGATAGATARQLRDLARDLRVSGIEADDATAIAQSIAGSRRVGAGQAGEIASLARDIGAGSPLSATEAAKRLVEMFDKGATAVRSLDAEFDLLSVSEAQQVRHLSEIGNQAGVLDIALQALHRRFDGLHREAMSPMQQALKELRAGWDGFLESLGNNAEILRITRMLGQLAQAAGDVVKPTASSTSASRAQRDLDTARDQLRRAEAVANPNQVIVNLIAELRAKVANLEAQIGGSGGGMTPTTSNRFLEAQLAARAAAAETSDAKRLEQLLQADTDRLAVLRAPAASRDILQAQLAARREAGGIVPTLGPDATEALVRSRTAVASAQRYAGALDPILDLERQAEGMLKVAEAYRVSSAAGRAAEAQLEAETAIRKSGVLPLLDRQREATQALASAQALAQATNDNQDLARQLADNQRLADARKTSNAAAEEAGRVIDLERYRNSLLAKTKTGELAPAIEQEIARRGELTAAIQAQARADRLGSDVRQARDDIRLSEIELQLQDQTEQVRARTLAIERERFRLQREYGAELPREAEELLRLKERHGEITAQIAERQRQTELWAEPLKNAISGIQSAFAGLFQQVFSGGVTSFRDLASAIKQVFIRLAAEIAALLVFRPIVGSVLGAVGLGGVSQSLGFTGAGGGGGGIPGLGGFSFPSFDIFNSGGITGAGASNPFSGITNFFNGTNAAAPAIDTVNAGGQAVSIGGPSSGLGLAGSALGFAGGAYGVFNAAKNGPGGVSGGVQGALSGAMAGFSVGGPWGAAAGAVIGGLAGGFGGKKPSVGANESSRFYLDPATGQLVAAPTGADNGGGNGPTLGLASEAARALNELAQARGTSVTAAAETGIRQLQGQLGFSAAGLNYATGTTEQTAVADLVRDAISRGALAGISQIPEEEIAAAIGGKLTDTMRTGVLAAIDEQIRAQQQLADAYSRTAESIQQTIGQLKVSDISPLTPAQRLAEARGQFAAVVGRAKEGDIDALGEAGQLAQQVLQLSRAYSPAGYGSDFSATLSTLGDLKGVAGRFASEANSNVETLMGLSLEAQTASLGELKGMRASIDGMIDRLDAVLAIGRRAA